MANPQKPHWYDLWKYFSDNHDLTLLESELDDIVQQCKLTLEGDNRALVNEITQLRAENQRFEEAVLRFESACKAGTANETQMLAHENAQLRAEIRLHREGAAERKDHIKKLEDEIERLKDGPKIVAEGLEIVERLEKERDQLRAEVEHLNRLISAYL